MRESRSVESYGSSSCHLPITMYLAMAQSLMPITKYKGVALHHTPDEVKDWERGRPVSNMWRGLDARCRMKKEKNAT